MKVGRKIVFGMTMMAKIQGDLVYKSFASPLGIVTVLATNDEIKGLLWAHERESCAKGFVFLQEKSGHPLLLKVEGQLMQYFSGQRQEFDLEVAPQGTFFQESVWAMLAKIPYGETTSYGELAAQTGDVRRARAVAAAIAKNPIGIIVPCHRVLGKSGALVGFSGGLKRKSFLLDLELGNKELSKKSPTALC